MPLVARLYSPNLYGAFAIFMAITGFGAAVSTFRYEHAVMLPRAREDALRVVSLVFALVLGVALISAIPLFLFTDAITSVVQSSEIAPYLALAPVGIMLGGWSAGLNYWLNRNSEYRTLATNRVLASLVAVTVTLAAGAGKLGVAGLIVGALCGQATGFLLAFWAARTDFSHILSSFRFRTLLQTAKIYSRFPRLSLPADALNNAAQQTPIVLLAALFGQNVSGHYSFSVRLLGAPFSLIAGAAGDVFKQKAAADYHAHGNCRELFKRTLKFLSLMSIAPFLLLFFFAPTLFRVVFGAEWEEAGVYTQYLSVVYIARFIVSPLTYVFYLTERQDLDLIGQTLLLVLTVGSIGIGAWLDSPRSSLLLFALAYLIVYSYYFIVARRLSHGKTNSMAAQTSGPEGGETALRS